jgi:hypothetical protein
MPPCVRRVAAWIGFVIPRALEDTHGSLRTEVQRRGGGPHAAPESSSLEAVSQKIGIGVATLERWRAGALAASDGNGNPRPWTPAARLEAVIATAAMDEAARSAWCHEHSLFPADLDRWKQDALGGLGEPRDDGAAEAKQDQAAKRTDATQSG